jgi:dynactin 4
MASFSTRYAALLSGKGSFKARQPSRTLLSRMRPSSHDEGEKPLEYSQIRSPDDESALVECLQALKSLDETTTMKQRDKQVSQPRSEQNLWPINMQLRAKRSKRCRACHHILVKPENKPASTRFRIKMLAQNYIPAIHVRRYTPGSPLPPLTANVPPAILSPGTTHSFILTITNPLYDPIQLTLSTPATTPGPLPHTTTILRPDFTVGANADIWNDDEDTVSPTDKDKRKSKFGIFEARRNMISIFMEVVPAIPSQHETNTGTKKAVDIEVPIFVKMVYQSEDVEKDDTLTLVNQALEEKEKGKVEREIGYWVAVKVGTIKM